jgi:hypothetical protein
MADNGDSFGELSREWSIAWGMTDVHFLADSWHVGSESMM